MSNVDAKGFLNDTRCLTEQIRHTQEKLTQIDAMLGVSGLDISQERVSGTKSHDRLTESLDKLQDYREELAGLIVDYIALQRFAESVIMRLEDSRYQQVINLRYMEGMGWRKIAKAMIYSERNVRNIHKDALEALDAVLAEG
ncbi:MAG: sigma factor-like helix-turn-helix DNA-binding protein, partial [Raoultibacter sp.]